MHRKHSLAHLISAIVVALSLTPLMIVVETQAQIAFQSDRDRHIDVIHGWPNYEIYVMDTNGGNQRRLTNNPFDDRDPSWSPDGKRIAFVSNRDGPVRGGFPTPDIYVMDADGGNPQNLTNNPHGDFGPAWLNSPFSVSPASKQFTMWGWLKLVDR